MPPPPTVVCQVVGTLSMKYIWLGTRASPGPRYNPRGPTTARPVPGARPRPPSRRSWEAVGLIVAPSLERLWGACGSRETYQMRSRDFQETTRDDPNRLLGVPLGVGPPTGGPGASRRQPRRPRRGLPPQRRAGCNKYQKRMNISLRRNVHAVEVRSPYWSKDGAGRTRITTASRKVQQHAKNSRY